MDHFSLHDATMNRIENTTHVRVDVSVTAQGEV